jgi:transcriptional regulator with XRE-family HTH domain
MASGKEKNAVKMSPKEIQELLDLKGWTKTDLASALGVGDHAVYQWLTGRRTARGAVCVLMRQWLGEARENVQPVKAAR